MLKKNRSAPNTAVIPVLCYTEVREAVDWPTTALPFAERLRNSDDRCQLLHSNGAIVVAKAGVHAKDAPSTQRAAALRHTSCHGNRRTLWTRRSHLWRTAMLVPRPMGTSVDALGDHFRFQPSR